METTDRVSQNMLEVLANLLITDVKDPRVENVQITAVDVTPDLRYAKVFYVLLDKREPDDDAQDGLERAGGFLRRELGDRLTMRYVPELRFEYDESVERGRRMDELLRTIDTPAEEEP
ncbi:MAG: 30S ribosome-binding factor RbfA [bacterium]